jgi:beta-galactosidase
MAGKTYEWDNWGEQIEPGEKTMVLARYNDQFYEGTACCLKNNPGKGAVWYIGVDTDGGNLKGIF